MDFNALIQRHAPFFEQRLKLMKVTNISATTLEGLRLRRHSPLLSTLLLMLGFWGCQSNSLGTDQPQ